MKENDLSVFEMETEGAKLKLERGSLMAVAPVAAPAPLAAPSAVSAGSTPANAEPSAGPEISSPMVGTYYSAPSPDSPVFVKVGDEVTEDTVVCIIEAMKVMNEVKADRRGTITAILAENGKPVQYGQPLFRLAP